MPGHVFSVGVCVLYMLVGPILVIVNKEILATGFAYPMLLSSLGLVFASATAHLLAAIGVVKIGKQDVVTWSFWARKVFPVGACHAATLAFGNAQYLYMGVAMIQFLKAFTPIVVTAVAALLLGDKPSLRKIVALFALCAGTSVSASGDTGVGAFGLLLASGSATTEAVRLVLTQFVLQDCKFTLWESQYYLAPGAAVCLVATGLWYEGASLWSSGDLRRLLNEKPASVLTAASFGLGVQLLTSAVIQGPGAVTLKVLSQVRNAGLVLVGVVVYSEAVTAVQGCGYALSLAAFAGYNAVIIQEKRAASSATKEITSSGGGAPDQSRGASVGNDVPSTDQRASDRGMSKKRDFEDPLVRANSAAATVTTEGSSSSRRRDSAKAKASPHAAVVVPYGGGVAVGLAPPHVAGSRVHARIHPNGER